MNNVFENKEKESYSNLKDKKSLNHDKIYTNKNLIGI